MITFSYTFHLTFICATATVAAAAAAAKCAVTFCQTIDIVCLPKTSLRLPLPPFSLFLYFSRSFYACETNVSMKPLLAFCGHKRNPMKYADLILNCDTFAFWGFDCSSTLIISECACVCLSAIISTWQYYTLTTVSNPRLRSLEAFHL